MTANYTPVSFCLKFADHNRTERRRWNLNGEWPREDGRIEWYCNGYLHRTDGPAVIRPSGTHEWYLNGKRHRTDGPAVIHPDGATEWYLDGNRMLPTQWLAASNKTPGEQLMLIIKYNISK